MHQLLKIVVLNGRMIRCPNIIIRTRWPASRARYQIALCNVSKTTRVSFLAV